MSATGALTKAVYCLLLTSPVYITCVNRNVMTNSQQIDTYIINLPQRQDRKAHILQTFADKPEFSMQVIPAITHKTGAVGLWLTLQQIVRNAGPEKPYILLCEDDHQFTTHYSTDKLFSAINTAHAANADLLLGGVSWFGDVVQIAQQVFWVDQFTGLQFTIIFNRFYQKILEADFFSDDSSDFKLSMLSAGKLLMHPFISTQKEFGYSDVTAKNDNNPGHIDKLFSAAGEKLQHLKTVRNFYHYQK